MIIVILCHLLVMFYLNFTMSCRMWVLSYQVISLSFYESPIACHVACDSYRAMSFSHCVLIWICHVMFYMIFIMSRHFLVVLSTNLPIYVCVWIALSCYFLIIFCVMFEFLICVLHPNCTVDFRLCVLHPNCTSL